MSESQSINSSLSTLGNVVNALVEKVTYVPYRESKLTKLLRDSLGGQSKALMFVNISPAATNLQETHSSLEFGSRANAVQNCASKGESTKQVENLKKEIERA